MSHMIHLNGGLEVRQVARVLGLRDQSKVTKCRLGFHNAPPIHSFWLKMTQATLPISNSSEKRAIQPFQHIIALVDEYGPQIWGRKCNRSWLLRAGEHPDYPNDLHFPADRDMILEIVRVLYDQRNKRCQTSGTQAYKERSEGRLQKDFAFSGPNRSQTTLSMKMRLRTCLKIQLKPSHTVLSSEKTLGTRVSI